MYIPYMQISIKCRGSNNIRKDLLQKVFKLKIDKIKIKCYCHIHSMAHWLCSTKSVLSLQFLFTMSMSMHSRTMKTEKLSRVHSH